VGRLTYIEPSQVLHIVRASLDIDKLAALGRSCTMGSPQLKEEIHPTLQVTRKSHRDGCPSVLIFFSFAVDRVIS
jgi:hypothetical protein